MRELTDSESKAYRQVYNTFLEASITNDTNRFKAGFIAGIDYQQTKLNKLIAYIKGEVTRSEIEEILDA